MKNNWNVVVGGGSVQRFHTCSTIGHQTVAEHSWGVAAILLSIYPHDMTVNLLTAAIYHDVAEQATGDIPATVKWSSPEIKAGLKRIEDVFEAQHGLKVELTKDERSWLSFADMCDLLWFVYRQMAMGNQLLGHVWENGLRWCTNWIITNDRPESAIDFINQLIDRYHAINSTGDNHG